MATSNALAGVVLAGGKSSRFGSDKASALLEGRPLLAWVVAALEPRCDEIIVVKAAGQVLPAWANAPGFTEVEDFVAGEGPLAGLIAGFAAAHSEACFLTSCDAPLLRPEVLRLCLERLLETGAEAACPLVDGRLQPLVCAYRREPALTAANAAFASGERSLQGLLARLRVDRLGESEMRRVDPSLASFRNANDPSTLARIAAQLRSRPAQL